MANAKNGFNFAPPPKCKCGWQFNTWHICVDLSTPEPVRAVQSKPAMSAEQRALIGEKVREKAKTRNAARDAKIVELYLQGTMGTKKVADEVGCDRKTVIRVLRLNGIESNPVGKTMYRPGPVHGAFN